MLALKNVLAENDQIMTLIFDEVDTGVSGRAAQKVAEKLAEWKGVPVEQLARATLENGKRLFRISE